MNKVDNEYMKLYGYNFERKTKKYQRKNFELESIISKLLIKGEETKMPIYNTLAKLLKLPRRNKIQVNVGDICKNSKENDMVIVPGKVLSMGTLDHKVTIVCYGFSESAKEKLDKTGTKVMSFEDFLALPSSKVKFVRILR